MSAPIASFKDLQGKTLQSVLNEDNERILFITTTGEKYALYHSRECCESVNVEEVVGNLDGLFGVPILLAEEVDGGSEPPTGDYESFTWTFYKLSTVKGDVTIRWLGESNGYYSESVDFAQLEP